MAKKNKSKAGSTLGAKKLISYPVDEHALDVGVAPLRRDWMDKIPSGHIYRCIPVSIANQAGWELLCPMTFDVTWNGGITKSDLEIKPVGDFEPWQLATLMTHFGHGILTFHPKQIFRTPKGYNLWMKGPSNYHKDGIAPMEGIIEADWLPYPGTMNWRFTRENHTVRFERGEPIAHIVPYPKNLLEKMEPTRESLDSNPGLKEKSLAWANSRKEYKSKVFQEGSKESKERFQKYYVQGKDASGNEYEHQNKLKLKEFTDKTKS